MSLSSLHPQLAPAERVSPDVLMRQSSGISNIPMFRQLMDAVPDLVMILNDKRQIVFTNRAVREFTHQENIEAGLGLRPGEFIGCIHSREESGGCGTTEFCSTCGATKAILTGLAGISCDQECRILLAEGEALDMGVYATPLILSGQPFIFFVLKDISHEKRRLILEHLFFHDMMNSVGALRGLTEVWQRAPFEEKDEIAREIWQVCDWLIDEIRSQKQLLAAEKRELVDLSFAPNSSCPALLERAFARCS